MAVGYQFFFRIVEVDYSKLGYQELRLTSLALLRCVCGGGSEKGVFVCVARVPEEGVDQPRVCVCVCV